MNAMASMHGFRAAAFVAPLLALLLLAPAAEAGETGAIHFGARADAPPISYRTADGRFRGYAIDICEAVKKVYRARHPEREIAEDYVLVTTADRQEKLRSGAVDTLCGPFSMTEGRMADFDFSFLIFVSGGSVAARRPSGVIPGMARWNVGEVQRVAVVSETTTLEFVSTLLGTSVEIDRKATHDEAFAALAAGEVSYYFGDRAILNAVVRRAANADEFVVGGKFLTYEPYALPFAKGRSPDLQDAANAAIAELFRSRRILGIYENHFPGQRPSDLLQSLFQLYALPE